MNDFELLNVITSEGISYEKLLLILFKDYENKKNKGTVYSMSDFEPEGLIKLYYKTIDEPKFQGLMEKFKRKYIKNENNLEQVHEKTEIEGLEAVYNYIQSYVTENNLNIFIILKLHGILYSKVPHIEFGGKFRNCYTYLLGSSIETEPWDNISKKFNELFLPVNELIKEGKHLGKEKNIERIMMYIDSCIELNSELIRIHPFFDGNGRTLRAFMNLLFKLAGVPPVYVESREQHEYQIAMNKAINEKDCSVLKKFYYYKICDSIFELDIKEKIALRKEEAAKSR